MTPKLIAFDLFGTVYDLRDVPREEKIAYVEHFSKPDWSPLALPESWLTIPLYPDAAEGLARLRKKCTVITLSNAPVEFQLMLGVTEHFDGICDLAIQEVFKPNPRAYMSACVEWLVDPADTLMVTGNPTLGRYDYGDVQAAERLGMRGVLIRHGSPETIIELAEQLGC